MKALIGFLSLFLLKKIAIKTFRLFGVLKKPLFSSVIVKNGTKGFENDGVSIPSFFGL